MLALAMGFHPTPTTKPLFRGHSGGDTPGPIPNPEVKPSSADGTARETAWESRTPRNTKHRRPPPPQGGRRRMHGGHPRHAIRCEERS